MDSVKRVLLFLLCNLTGLAIVVGTFYAILLYDVIDPQSLDLSAEAIQTLFIGVPMMIWVACAIFSFAIFFVSKKWRPFFYIAPMVAPPLFLGYAVLIYL